MCFLGALFLADTLLPLLMGQAFRPVANNLVVMTIALPFLGVVSMGSVLAMIGDRPGMALEASALRLAVFLILGVPLVGWWGSLGGSLAFVLAASSASAVLSATPAGAAAFLRAALGPGPGPGGPVRAPVLA